MNTRPESHPHSGPLLIAHRGDTNHFPENTIEAFASAFDHGADGVEMDIQLVDGQIRVVHNYLDESWANAAPPLLTDVLEKFAQVGRLEIEIKAYSEEILEPLNKLITQYQPRDLELTTSEIPLIPYMIDAFPGIPIGAIFGGTHYQEWMTQELYLRKIIGHMRLLRAQVVHLPILPLLPRAILNAAFVATLHAEGFLVHHHIPRSPDENPEQEDELFAYLSQIGIDQSTFDNINLVQKTRKETGP